MDVLITCALEPLSYASMSYGPLCLPDSFTSYSLHVGLCARQKNFYYKKCENVYFKKIAVKVKEIFQAVLHHSIFYVKSV